MDVLSNTILDLFDTLEMTQVEKLGFKYVEQALHGGLVQTVSLIRPTLGK